MNEEPVDTEALRAEIARAARIDNPAERALEIVAVIESVAAPLGIHPVVVGGMAVYFWTERDEFTTHDIDVVMRVPDELANRFAELGFERAPDRRHWALKGTDILLEAPASGLDAGVEVSQVKLRSGRLGRVISRVDILMDRLDEFQATGHETAAQQALALLADLSEEEVADLNRRAVGRDVALVLSAVRQIAAGIAAGKPPPDSGELHEIARAVIRGDYDSGER
jgi:hypothetical protein